MLEGLGELALAEAAVRRPEPTAAVQKAAVGLGDGLVEGPLRGAVPSLRELDLADRDPLLRDLVARVDRGRPREVGLRSEYGRAPLLLGLRPQPLFQLSLREGTEGLHSLHFARLAVVLPHVVARELLQHDHVLLVHALVVVDPRGVDPETQRGLLGFEKIHHELSVLHVRPGKYHGEVRVERRDVEHVLDLLLAILGGRRPNRVHLHLFHHPRARGLP
mmetsp:Transcript_567/g.1753  ORF Transcript_567/g.1753 Transcript_567/m.1753 type:complete len:219 (+) Transcript_567:4532-5188(+)